ncbi:MAG: tRNA dihydrouridine synthase DusB [Fuerstiella sp.]|nr:tRNA dihydrouridine synthase DusB [Fuerstiella sp.]
MRTPRAGVRVIKSAIPNTFRQSVDEHSSSADVVIPRPEFRGEVRFGSLILPTRYLLSPLAGFTTLPFRVIVRTLGGVGLATTDLVNCRALLARNERTMAMIESHPRDKPFAVQIFGSDPEAMTDAARFLEEHGVDAIDINMGCPVSRIAGTGSGAGMMCDIDSTVSLVQQVVESVGIPVSVKMRLGWDETQLTAPSFARAFEQVGVCAVAVHGRTREQGFSGSVSLAGIREVVKAVDKIPVIGNGDIRSVGDTARMIEQTGCHAVSIGRTALANPWIFRQLDEWERTGQYAPAGTFDERLQLMVGQFEFLEERYGSQRAIVQFRKMAHWYLKGMRVRKRLRGNFQFVRTRPEFDDALRQIREEGPVDGNRTGVLTDAHIPVPSGPIDKW